MPSSANTMIDELQLSYTNFAVAYLTFKSSLELIVKNETYSEREMQRLRSYCIPAEKTCNAYVIFFEKNKPEMNTKEERRYKSIQNMYMAFLSQITKEVFIILADKDNGIIKKLN